MEATNAGYVSTVLAVPARAEIVEILSQGESLTAQQLSQKVGLHLNTVRFHLDQLVESGLVSAKPVHQQRRGRPTLEYRLVSLSPVAVRDHMIDVLCDLVQLAGGADDSVLLAVGRKWAAQFRGQVPLGLAHLIDVFAEFGFAPEVDGSRVLLRTCPFAQSAHQNPELICKIHLGMAQQLLGDAGTKLELLPFAADGACVLSFTAATTGTDSAVTDVSETAANSNTGR